MQIQMIPLAEIDEGAITRDRLGLDQEPLDELRHSIAVNGLRYPIEVFALPEPYDDKLYGLISGYRRFFAYRDLLGLTGQERFAAIPAFVREHKGAAAAMAAMVEENEIRAGLSPLAKGSICVRAHREGIYDTIDQAVDGLFPSASRFKKRRLRVMAALVEELPDGLTAPERLSERQAERLWAAIGGGFGERIRTTLADACTTGHDDQWALLDPILAEAEGHASRPERSDRRGRRGGPGGIARPRPALTIRRERTGDGWSLVFTGREATSPLIDRVVDDIERMYVRR